MDYLSRIIEAGCRRHIGGVKPAQTLGYEMQQSPRELAAFCEWIAANGIRTYLEIGLRTGGTWKLLTDLFRFDKSCGITIDESELRVMPALGRKLIADSHSTQALKWAANHGPFDLVFIDASHKYADVLQDYRDYRGLARYMAFHDIAFCKGVRRLWGEVSKRHEVVAEIIDEEHNIGIGIIKL